MNNLLSRSATSILKARMFSKLLARICLAILGVQILVICCHNIWFNPMWSRIKEMLGDGFSTAWAVLKNWHLETACEVLGKTLSLFWDLESRIIGKSFIVWVVIPLGFLYYYFLLRDKNTKEYIQGARAISPEELNKIAHKKGWWDTCWKLRLARSISFSEVKLPAEQENKQTFVGGKPGSGKTNAFNQMILTIKRRKQKLIIHDYKGDYVEKFYNKDNGIIFNPLDERSVGWCLFNDCTSVMDIEAFAGSLIPDALPGSEPFWNNASRDILIGILHYCYSTGKTTNKDIWETAIMPNDQIYLLLSNTKGGERGAKHLEDSSGRTATSIMSNLMQYVKVFEYMVSMKGDFSINKWVTDKSESRTIFITNYAKLKHTLSPMISLFIQTVGNVLLSQSDDLNRRVFFILDEFGQMQNMSTIENLMTASRSKGGAIFIGVQDIGQIDKIYKKDTRATILNSASNRIIFNCKDHDTAKFFSTDIGETEYYEEVESQSLGMTTHDRISTSKQRRKEFLVTPEDIQSLPDLSAFVSIGHHDITLTKFKYRKIKNVAKAFMQRTDLNLAHVVDVAQVAYPKISVVEIGEPIKNINSQDESLSDVVDINTSIPLIKNLDKVDTGVSVC